MGIQINGNTDTISAIDGGLTVSGASLGSASASNLNISGIVTASSFSGPLTGNVTGNVNATGVSTITTLNATSIVGVSTAGITTVYTNSIKNTSGNTILQSSGSIIKVTSVNNPSNFNTASGSYVAVTGFTTTITPSSASNKYYAVATIGHINNYGAQILNNDAMKLTSTGSGAVDKFITQGYVNSNDGTGYTMNSISAFGTFTNAGIHTFAIFAAQSGGSSTTVMNSYAGDGVIITSNLTIFEIAG